MTIANCKIGKIRSSKIGNLIQLIRSVLIMDEIKADHRKHNAISSGNQQHQNEVEDRNKSLKYYSISLKLF